MDHTDTNQNIVEIPLSGEKLPKETNNLEAINNFGNKLFLNNRDFIREKVEENWYSVIEPVSGMFIASSDPNKLYEYTSEKYPNKLFYVLGILKNYHHSYIYG